MNSAALHCFLLAPALVAQAPRPAVTVYAPPEPTAARLERALKGTRGRLLIRSAGDQAFGDRLQALLKRAPLDELELPTETLAPGSRLENEVAQRLGLVPGPCWVLVDGDFRLLVQGRTVPDRPEVLAADLQAAGWKTRGEVLGVFLQRHPDHLEAQTERLRILLGQALRRLQPLLKEGTKEALKRPLTEAEDGRIFGPLARALEALLRDPAFPTVPIHLYGLEQTRDSALVRAAAGRCRPVVEAALRRQPGASGLWSLWSQLETLCPSKDALAFVTTVPQVEGEPFLVQPAILPPLLRSARITGRWADLLPLARRVWASDSGPNLHRSQRPDFLSTWDQSAGIVLECLLHLNRSAESAALVQGFLDWSNHGPAASWGAAMARSLGQADLARNVAGLQPGSGAGALLEGLPEKNLLQSGGGMGWTEPREDERPLAHLLAFDEAFRIFRIEPGTALRGIRPPPPGRWERDRHWERLQQSLERVDMRLPLRCLESATLPGRELMAREGWGAEPRWALLDRKGEVLAQGTTLPPFQTLVDLLRRHGFKSRHERVESLLKEHPDHTEALRAHLKIHRWRGEAILQRRDSARREQELWALQAEFPGKERAELQDPVFVARVLEEARKRGGEEAAKTIKARIAAELAKPLPAPPERPPQQPTEDPEPEWEETARILLQLLDQPDWADAHSGAGTFIPEPARESSAFRRVAPALHERAEALLLRHRGNLDAWTLWLEAAAITGADPVALAARIPRVEGVPSWHEARIQKEILKVLAAQKRWEALVAWTEPMWELWQEEPRDRRRTVFEPFPTVLRAWLELQRENRAEDWVNRMLGEVEEGFHSMVLDNAAAIAESAGRKDLAAAWRKRAQEARKAVGSR